MMFMNEMDVDWAADRMADHPTMGPATRTLQNLMRVVNVSSDGWAHWAKPVNAAKKLITCVQQAEAHERNPHGKTMPTAAEIRAAYTPIKTFCSRYAKQLNGTVEFVTPEDAPADDDIDAGWGRVR